MSQIVGPNTVVGSDNGINQDQRIVAMDNTIHLLEPSAAPLTVFMSRLRTGELTGNPKFQWLEDVLAPKTITFDNAAYNDNVTTLNVATGDGAKIASFDIIKNPLTGEMILVTVVTTDALTVVRGFGTTAGAAIAADQSALITGNANKENATRRDMLATSTTTKENFAQIFRTPFGFSRVLKNSNLYGQGHKPYQIKKKGIEHRVEMERSMLFGEPKEEISTDGGRWATGGIDHFITSNRYDAGGTLNYTTLLDYLQQVFRYGSQTSRLALAAPVVVSAIDAMAANRLFTQVSGTMFGVKVNKIQSSHGDLLVVKHPLLSETNFFNERMFTLDMDKLKERPFVGARTQLKMNIQTPSQDGEEHEYLTQMGLQVENQEASGVLFNVTSF